MKICNGGCGKEALFGSWCSERYQDCIGYKKKLSDKAKLRGNNGVRGILSKIYDTNDRDIKEYQLICFKCNTPFVKKLRGETFKRKKEFLCDNCIRQKVSESIKKTSIKKIDLLPYDKKPRDVRKQIKWDYQNHKCNRCDFNKYGPLSGPYELHHKDGNANNKSIDNEELLCCNCHSMTDNYRFKGGQKDGCSKSEKFGGVYTLWENRLKGLNEQQNKT